MTNNVGFLYGSQSNLNALLNNGTGKVQAGAFYLTNDTHRMYFGKDSDTIVPLNQGVITIASINDLPSVANEADKTGAFYYVTEGNILCVRSNGKWVQINVQNEEIDTIVSSLDYAGTVASNKATITTTIGLKDIAGKDLDNVQAEFSIEGSNLAVTVDGNAIKLTGDAYDLSTVAGTNSVEVDLNKNGAKSDGFSIKGSENVSVAVANDVITLTATDTKLNANSLTVESATGGVSVMSKIGDTSSNTTIDSSIDIVSNEHVAVTADNGKVKISGDSYAISAATSGNGVAINLDSELTDEVSTVSIAPVNNERVKVTANGNAISIDAEDTYISAFEVVEGANGFTVNSTVTHAINGNTSEGPSFEITPEIKIGKTTESTVSFVNGAADLDVYTTAEVDKLITDGLSGLDAMVFRGTVGTTDADVTSLPTSGVKIGDTYKVVTDITVGGIEATVGDLLIARGTETNGVITSGLEWSVVPSGFTHDTTYNVVYTDHGMQIRANVVGNTQEPVGEFQLAAGEKIVLTDSESTNGGRKVTVAHAAGVTADATHTGANQVARSEATITVPSFKVDGTGHVTDVSMQSYKVVDTHNDIQSVGITSVANNGIEFSVTSTDSTAKSEKLTFASSNSNITVATSGGNGAAVVTMGLVWGEF